MRVYEEGGAGDIGSTELVDKYKRETPGQSGYMLELIRQLMKEKKEKDVISSIGTHSS